MGQYPPIQIVNDRDEPIGGASLDETHKKGLLHRVVVIFIQDTNGRLLIQKRGPNVATHANKWDVSSAGHVDQGETYVDAAYREMAEELGLRGFELEAVDTIRRRTVIGDRIIDRFIGVFKTVIPAGTPIILQESEVSEVRWLGATDLKRLIVDHPEQLHDELPDLINRYYY